MIPISKRLKKESKRTHWQSGSFRSGDQITRLIWITERYIDVYPILTNPYLKKL